MNKPRRCELVWRWRVRLWSDGYVLAVAYVFAAKRSEAIQGARKIVTKEAWRKATRVTAHKVKG